MDFLPLEKNGNKVYAGFGKRFGAAVVDVLVFIPFFFIFYIFQFVVGISISIAIIAVILSNTLFSMYTVYFHFRFGATLGKMAVGIKVTLPNGSAIDVKQALLRSSVDLGFAIVVALAHVIAILNADPEQYLSAGWGERVRYITPLFPVWYRVVDVGGQIWYWGELLVLLLNKRKRAIHDFIAGTVVIQKQYAVQKVSWTQGKDRTQVFPEDTLP